ncbi:hypothetical protein LUR55_13975, partial [Luteimonas sp. C4P040a]|nr:hypothetical protein [Luteimonas fraxinea]
MTINRKIPLFGVRRFAREVLTDLAVASQGRDELRATLSRIGGLRTCSRSSLISANSMDAQDNVSKRHEP